MQRFLDRLGGNGPSFVGTKWTWRDGALWHLTTYASGWQEWKTFDEVAQSWHWVTQADKEALKDCAFARQLFWSNSFDTTVYLSICCFTLCQEKITQMHMPGPLGKLRFYTPRMYEAIGP